MTVEAGTTIADLDPTLPAGTDSPREGDDHLRLLKSILKSQFPNLDAPTPITADELNALVQGVAACVLKAGDTMTGQLELPSGGTGNEAVTADEVAAMIGAIPPSVLAGTVIMFGGNVAPDGYLSCDGQEISKTTYADLYAAIKDVWANTGGAASPSADNFRVPPQEVGGLGIFPRGKGAVGVGSYQVDVFKEHDHILHTDNQRMSIHDINVHLFKSGSNENLGDFTQKRGDTTETRPRTITMLMCIKT